MQQTKNVESCWLNVGSPSATLGSTVYDARPALSQHRFSVCCDMRCSWVEQGFLTRGEGTGLHLLLVVGGHAFRDGLQETLSHVLVFIRSCKWQSTHYHSVSNDAPATKQAGNIIALYNLLLHCINI